MKGDGEELLWLRSTLFWKDLLPLGPGVIFGWAHA